MLVPFLPTKHSQTTLGRSIRIAPSWCCWELWHPFLYDILPRISFPIWNPPEKMFTFLIDAFFKKPSELLGITNWPVIFVFVVCFPPLASSNFRASHRLVRRRKKLVDHVHNLDLSFKWFTDHTIIQLFPNFHSSSALTRYVALPCGETPTSALYYPLGSMFASHAIIHWLLLATLFNTVLMLHFEHSILHCAKEKHRDGADSWSTCLPTPWPSMIIIILITSVSLFFYPPGTLWTIP